MGIGMADEKALAAALARKEKKRLKLLRREAQERQRRVNQQRKQGLSAKRGHGVQEELQAGQKDCKQDTMKKPEKVITKSAKCVWINNGKEEERVRAYEDFLNAKDRWSRTALSWAVFRNHAVSLCINGYLIILVHLSTRIYFYDLNILRERHWKNLTNELSIHL